MLRIATMTAREVAFAVELAAAEGWNPGLDDAAAFRAADPDGFLIGYLGDRPVGCISAVAYERHFGFIGLYIVVPEHRGQGHGIALWRAGMARLAGRNVALDGVLAQQENYRRSGFRMAYSNLRFERRGALPAEAEGADLVALSAVSFGALCEYDRRFFPARRDAFLRHWIAQPGSRALACVAQGRLRGCGVIRRCRVGWKIGPLFAEAPEIAERLYLALCRDIAAEPVYLDVPEVSTDGLALAQKYAMSKVFGTARMYTGELPAIAVDRTYGVTTFELG